MALAFILGHVLLSYLLLFEFDEVCSCERKGLGGWSCEPICMLLLVAQNEMWVLISH